MDGHRDSPTPDPQDRRPTVEEDPETRPTVEEDPETHPRKKRRKYIAKACNECKRRKIKCNGQSPCQRCGRQRIDCVYVENPRREDSVGDQQQSFERLFERMEAMQEQISTLSAAVYSLARNGPSPRQDPSGQPQRSFRHLSSAKESAFQGPTTSAYSFGLAKSSLQQRGIVERNEIGDEGDLTQEPSPLPSPPSPNYAMSARHSGDPLWTIGKTEALRLCRVYEEEMGIMYPVVELEQLLHQVHQLYSQVDRGPWPKASFRSDAGDGGLKAFDVHILRLVFACALTAEASGSSELAMALFESVREVADNCVWGPPDIDSIIFLTLVSIFYFQMDEETLAWRTIGIVERMSLEKGLHRRETLNQPAVMAVGKDRLLRLFWSIYILDMRWSFGTGMPSSLDDTDIDPWLPEPEEQTPYLRVMIRYSRITAKVWKFISASNNTGEIKKDEMNYLDWQVLQWAAEIPDPLRFDNPSVGRSEPEQPRSLRRLRSLLYLRANQLRMLIHRPVLHSASHIVRYPSESQTVVDIANDTIRFITRLNETSDIYQLQQVAFNWFLVSALAVLFLAVAQSPRQFSSRCKEEFYMALELVKGFSSQSYISRRLWKSIKGLRKLGPQLGLQKHRHIAAAEPTGQAHELEGPDRNAVVLDTVDQAPALSTQSLTPQDGAQMTEELMEWFEAVGNLENQIMGVSQPNFEDPAMWQSGSRIANGGYVYDYGGELSSVMRDLF